MPNANEERIGTCNCDTEGIDCTMHKEEGWEEEFDKEYNRHGIFIRKAGKSYQTGKGGLSNAHYEEVSYKLKAFISKTVEQAKKEVAGCSKCRGCDECEI